MSYIKISRVNYDTNFHINFETLQLYELYNRCFSEPPYDEYITKEEVYALFQFYSSSGALFLAFTEPEHICIAFAAGVPLKEELEISRIAKEHGLDIDKYWYFADFGVAREHRRKGIGKEIVKKLINNIPSSHIIMRTQENNIASQKCNTSVGFKIIPDMKQVVFSPRTNGVIEQDTRIFLEYTK